MATKKAKPKKPKGKNAKGSKPKRGNVERGPALREKVRVPINPTSYAAKESELAQLEVQARKIERKIKPDKDQLRILAGKINTLTNDLADETEEVEKMVEREYHFGSNEVRFFDADTGKEFGDMRRTMTADERKRNLDLEDKFNNDGNSGNEGDGEGDAGGDGGEGGDGEGDVEP